MKESVLTVAIQPNGKILVTGYSQKNGNSDTFLIRYNSNGSLDTSFGDNGILIETVISGSDQANSVCLKPDGKILAAGQAHNGTDYDFFLIQYK